MYLVHYNPKGYDVWEQRNRKILIFIFAVGGGSEERAAIVALQAMNFEEPDIPEGVELEVSVEHINADNDPVFTGYRNQNVSDSDSSDSD